MPPKGVGFPDPLSGTLNRGNHLSMSPCSTLGRRFGSPATRPAWGPQRRRFASWTHARAWMRMADAIAAEDIPEQRKGLYRSVAEKAERQKKMLPEYRARVAGFRG